MPLVHHGVMPHTHRHRRLLNEGWVYYDSLQMFKLLSLKRRRSAAAHEELHASARRTI